MKEVGCAALIGLAVLALAVGSQIFAAKQEAAAFNRCHPGANVTTWEAMWAAYRIQDCVVPK